MFGFYIQAQFQVNGNQTAASLVDNVLFGQSCGTTSNHSISSNQNVGYFNRNNTTFPIQDGIIIRTGSIANSPGNYSPDLARLSSQINSNSDAYLLNLSNSSGQTANITDTSFLQFDFNTVSNSFSFDFLFASNEYGQFQCGFSDVFAFVLTDLVTNVSTNLAVVPATSTPVSVKTIRNNAFNAGCTSSFQELFGSYNVNNPAGSPINFRGQTILLNASSNIIPNRNYRIRLVIGDYDDSSFDSAIFISNGEFLTFTDLGLDFSICSGNSRVINSNLSPTLYTFKWFRNGVLLTGSNNPSFTVTQSGTYRIEAIEINGECKLVDEVIVSDLTYSTPTNIVSCNTQTTQNIFNLNVNNAQSMGLNPAIYEIRYFKNNVLIPLNQYANYNGIPNETLIIRIFNLISNEYCVINLPVQLLIENSTNANQPNNVILCQGTTSFNLTSVNAQVLNVSNSSNYNITFHTSQIDAQNDTNPINNPSNYAISGNETIWIRLELISNSVCFATTSFQISFVNAPLVDTLNNVTTCSSYTLQALVNGNYYTGSNGTGTQLTAGSTINTTTTLYIFNRVPNSNCSVQTSFTITIQLPSVFPNTINVCSDSGYTIPNTPFGSLYSGPGGAGTLLTVGSVINTTQTIHYYYNLNGIICANQAILINIIQNPTATQLANYISCLPYTLPVIASGNYFTGPNGTGTPLFAGDVISTTQTIYIFAGTIPCISQTQFQVTILVPEDLESISGCIEVTVPYYLSANFYTQPNGQGTLIPAGTILTTNQTIYLFFQNIQIECITYVGTQIIINPLPLVDDLNDVYTCASNGYVLPTLTNGNYTGNNIQGVPYAAGMVINVNSTITIENTNSVTSCSNSTNFTITIVPINISPINGCLQIVIPSIAHGNFYQNPNGQGLIPTGTVLTQSQTIYFFSSLITTTPNCTENIPIQVTIFQIPAVDDPADVVNCGSYTLPPLQNGNYYSLEGTALIPVGTVISQTTTLLVFNYNGCQSPINPFTISIINVNDFQPIERCEKYVIPQLTIGNYYNQPNGQGNTIPAGTEITTSQTIYYYVATTQNNNCTTNLEINITINPLPSIVNQSDRIECESYFLPPLSVGNYFEDSSGLIPIDVSIPITTTQTIYVYAINQFGCKNFDDFTITISQKPQVTSFNDEFECYSYTLPIIPIGLGSYYTQSGGLGTQLQPGTVITTTQTIYIFNSNSILASCYGQTNFTVNIEGLQVASVSPIAKCDSYVLPPLTVGNYFNSPNGVNPINTNIPITTTQIVYVYAQNVNTRGQICFDEKSFVVTISQTPILPDFSAQFGCGSYQLPPLTVGNYYTQPNGQGTLLNAGALITFTQTIHVYAAAIDNINCIATQKSFLVSVFPLRTLNINKGMICYNYTTNELISSTTLASNVNPNQFTVNWYFNNVLVFSGPNFTPTQQGVYTVSTIKLTPEAHNDCNYAPTQVIVERSSPIVATIIYNDAFTNKTFIEVISQGGYGTYEYQLNNGPFQASNRFENLSSGYYTVTIIDTKGGCNSLTLEAYIINYPHFFTPNGDNYNDFWNITDLYDFKESKIHIFDRYGKFLKEIFPNKQGWDGRYNNEDMPSSDYWFVVYFRQNNIDNTFRAHFSLKR